MHPTFIFHRRFCVEKLGDGINIPCVIRIEIGMYNIGAIHSFFLIGLWLKFQLEL